MFIFCFAGPSLDRPSCQIPAPLIKDSQKLKDVSAWVLQSISENTADYTLPALTAMRVAHLFMVHFQYLLQMQMFISHEMDISACPCTPKELKMKALKATYPGAEKMIKVIHMEMKQLNSTAITSGHWSLDCFTHNHWHQNTKNHE